MADLNKVLLIGRLGAKPELRKTQAGISVARLSVATSHTTQSEGRLDKDTEWHSVVVFDKLAEQCVQFLDKGRLVYVEGSLRSRTWTGKDGQERTEREVKAHHVHFLSPRKAAEGEVAPLALA